MRETKEGSGIAYKVNKDLSGYTDDEFERWFKSGLSNWICSGIDLILGVKAEQRDNDIFVQLPNGQQYTVSIQKGIKNITPR